MRQGEAELCDEGNGQLGAHDRDPAPAAPQLERREANLGSAAAGACGPAAPAAAHFLRSTSAPRTAHCREDVHQQDSVRPLADGPELEPDHPKADCSGRQTKHRVVGSHYEVYLGALAPHEGRCQVNGVQRAEDNGEGLRRASENGPGRLDHRERLEDPIHGLASSRDFTLGDSLEEAQPVEGPQAFHF